MKLPPPANDSEGGNLTPLIDVVFLLLIFFLVATRFDQEEREIKTRLPEVAEAQPLTKAIREVVVNITEKGDYRIGGDTYSAELLEDLLRELRLQNPHQRVQIHADRRVPFDYPAKVMGICEDVDIEHYISVWREE